MKKYLLIIVIAIPTLSFSQNLNDGLIAYFPFSGNALDSSGHGNNGSIVGATLASDRFGHLNSAYYFDGNQDEIRISGAFNDQQPFSTNASVCYWLNTNTTKTAAAILTFHTACTNNNDDLMTFYINNAAGSHYLYNTVYWHSPVMSVDESNVTDSAWHLVCYTYKHDSATLYLDGIKVQKSYVTPAAGYYFDKNTDLVIGNISTNNCGYDFFFEGSIDDIRLYNRTLSDWEVTNIKNNRLTAESPLTLYKPVLYPNPAMSSVNISNICPQTVLIELTDITGKVLSVNNNKQTEMVTIDLSGYSNGLYQIFFKNNLNQIIQTEKIIISK